MCDSRIINNWNVFDIFLMLKVSLPETERGFNAVT